MADSQTAPDANLLVVRNLRIEATVRPPGEKPHDILIVDNVSLTLQKGRVLGLIGESGAGKSTIGLSALGYGRGGVRITGGEVFLNGRDILKGGASGLRAIRHTVVHRALHHLAHQAVRGVKGGGCRLCNVGDLLATQGTQAAGAAL